MSVLDEAGMPEALLTSGVTSVPSSHRLLREIPGGVRLFGYLGVCLAPVRRSADRGALPAPGRGPRRPDGPHARSRPGRVRSRRSRQSQTGALVPYARGTLRLQHVTFFNWCEPPMGASLSVHRDSVRLEGRNLFPAGLVHHRRCPWVPALPPGPSPACAVPCGRLGAGSLRWSRPSTAWAAAP